MKLVDDWRVQLNRAWSVRAAIFTGLLGISDQLLNAIFGTGHLPPVMYSLLMVVVTVAKVLDQQKP